MGRVNLETRFAPSARTIVKAHGAVKLLVKLLTQASRFRWIARRGGAAALLRPGALRALGAVH